MSRRDLDSDVARHRLSVLLDTAVAALPEPPPTPTYVVDLDAFDANATDLVRRAAGKPIRLASKSLRVPALISRALARPGFAGVLSYSLREALWLQQKEVSDDIVMGYPTVDATALAALVSDEQAARSITLMVDDVAQLELVDRVREDSRVPVRVALDVDAGLRLGRAHVGPKRSPLHDAAQVAALAHAVIARPGFTLVGVMTYEGQVAGVPDDVPGERVKSLVVRRMKDASVAQVRNHRRTVAEALDGIVDLEFWNAGGSGSVESTVADPVVTEVAAGSGLLVPHLFDHYRGFEPQPAAFFGLRVARLPARDTVTVSGGGLVASGAAGTDRAPLPWAPPGLHVTSVEGAGEVQTPLVGPGAGGLSIGDLVWFRHAKAGEVAEHVSTAHLLTGPAIVDQVPTYRGNGHTW